MDPANASEARVRDAVMNKKRKIEEEYEMDKAALKRRWEARKKEFEEDLVRVRTKYVNAKRAIVKGLKPLRNPTVEELMKNNVTRERLQFVLTHSKLSEETVLQCLREGVLTPEPKEPSVKEEVKVWFKAEAKAAARAEVAQQLAVSQPPKRNESESFVFDFAGALCRHGLTAQWLLLHRLLKLGIYKDMPVTGLWCWDCSSAYVHMLMHAMSKTLQ